MRTQKGARATTRTQPHLPVGQAHYNSTAAAAAAAARNKQRASERTSCLAVSRPTLEAPPPPLTCSSGPINKWLEQVFASAKEKETRPACCVTRFEQPAALPIKCTALAPNTHCAPTKSCRRRRHLNLAKQLSLSLSLVLLYLNTNQTSVCCRNERCALSLSLGCRSQ